MTNNYKLRILIKNINIFGITGSSGGGKIPSIKNHHSIRSKDVFSYNINNHRHLGEIFETYGKLNSNNLSFIPTSGSFIRGIFLNCFVETNQNYHFDSDKVQIEIFYPIQNLKKVFLLENQETKNQHCVVFVYVQNQDSQVQQLTLIVLPPGNTWVISFHYPGPHLPL